ncbi:MAG TPA: hypothetical protein VMW74_09130 [Nitrosopumilaceae archaeon]|nr:hypothetical protein [Nitrosopumilaceae archaeon]
MLFNQIRCLEDFERLTPIPNMKNHVGTYMVSEIMSILHSSGAEILEISEMLCGLNYNFFESLYLLMGQQIVDLPFASEKLKHIIWYSLDRQKAFAAKVVDSQEIKLNKIMDDLDELIMKKQMKEDSMFLFDFFQKQLVEVQK